MAHAPQYQYYFTGVMQDDKIYEQSGFSNLQQIGVRRELYEDLIAKHETLKQSYNAYQKMLIELDAIEIPKTQEDLIKDQASQLVEMKQTIKSQAEQLEEIRHLVSKIPQQMKSMMEMSNEHSIDPEFNCGTEYGLVKNNDPSLSSGPKNAKKSNRFTSVHKSKQCQDS